MRTKLTFKITFDSDYHVSDGQRFGFAVNSRLLRDHNDSPILRGAALAGLLRDGFDDLLDLVERSGVTAKRPFVGAKERLFGSPKTPKAWRFSSTKTLKARSGERWGSDDVWRVRINPRTRRADPQKLFVQEKGDGRLCFIFTAVCDTATKESRADAALLVAAASMVRHLGSGRRRGSGQCQLQLIQAENFMDKKEAEQLWEDCALATFQSYWLEGEELPAIVNEPTEDLQSDNDNPIRFRLIAKLAEPVIVANKSQVANAFETLSTIPGTVLLGAFANRAARQGNIKNDPAARQQFIAMFLRGGISTTGLLPAKGKRQLHTSVTAPQAWAQCELYPEFSEEGVKESHGIYDLSLSTEQNGCDKEGCESKLKPVRGYINLEGNFSSHNVVTNEEVHIALNRQTGRVEEGVLYTYEMIQAGQWFVGELRCAPQMWRDLQRMTGLRANQLYSIRLGKATRRGYGLTHLFLEEIGENEPSPWVREELASRVEQSGVEQQRELTMLFLTDAIVVDRWGRFHQGINRTALAEWLEMDMQHIGEALEVFVNGRSIDSFNTHRRMPRWRDEALTAGSMVRFTLTGLTDEAIVKALQKVEKEGIGLRRHEGFGNVAFNHPVFNQQANINAIPLSSRFTDELETLANNNNLANTVARTMHQDAHFAQRTWQKELEDHQRQHQKLWQEKLTDAFEPVARLIYLHRHQDVGKLLKWFEKDGIGREHHLWGNRELVGRDNQPKLDEDVIKEITNLLKKLEGKRQSQQTVGMTMLAERLGEQMNENRQPKEVAHG